MSASGHLLWSKTKSLEVVYNCAHAGGVSTVVLNVNCGGGNNKKDEPDLQVVWTKHCSHLQKPRQGIDVRMGSEVRRVQIGCVRDTNRHWW